MKIRIVHLIESVLKIFPWIIYIFLDNIFLRKKYLKKLLLYRPDLFESYFAWKPIFFPEKILVIIKTDAIGDYIIFHNALRVLCTSEKYKDFKRILLGNEVWNDLATGINSDIIDHFIFINRNQFQNPADSYYRIEKLLDLNVYSVHTSIYFSHSRENLSGDWIIKNLTSSNKIGSKGDCLCQTYLERKIGDNYYSKLIEIDTNITFELIKNKIYVEKILGNQLNNFHFDLQRPKFENDFKEKYFVIFIGASASFRRWPIENFVFLSQFLIRKYGNKLVFCGGNEDSESVQSIIYQLPKDLTLNLCGKESLYNFLGIVAGCELLVSNETSAVHIGVGLHKKTVCISNGNHYGRFNPYENFGFQDVKTVYPDSILTLTEEQRLELYANGSTIDISVISLDAVIGSIEALLNDYNL